MSGPALCFSNRINAERSRIPLLRGGSYATNVEGSEETPAAGQGHSPALRSTRAFLSTALLKIDRASRGTRKIRPEVLEVVDRRQSW